MTATTPAEDWLATKAPAGFEDFAKTLTWHHAVRWDVPDYVSVDELPGGTDGRRITEDLAEVEALSSDLGPGFPGAGEPEHLHALVLDIDHQAWLIPSSTPGHSHLYVDLPVLPGDLWDFLDAAAKIGLVEEGYVSACKSRDMTSVRAPWIAKGEEPSTLRRAAQAAAEISATGGAF